MFAAYVTGFPFERQELMEYPRGQVGKEVVMRVGHWIKRAAVFCVLVLAVSSLHAQVGLGGPAIQVMPANLDFGPVLVGTSRSLQVEITNVGDQPLVVQDMQFDTFLSTDFVQTAGPPQANILPGEMILVEITFSPPAPNPSDGLFAIQSNDPTNPLLFVPLFGQGEPPSPCDTVGVDVNAVLQPGQPRPLCLAPVPDIDVGKALVLTLLPAGPGDEDDGNILYARPGLEPVPLEDFEAISAVPFQARQRLVLPAGVLQEPLSVVLEGAAFRDNVNQVRFTSEVVELALADRGILPARVANAGSVTATIRGGGFQAGTSFSLVHPTSGDRIDGVTAVILDTTRAEVAFAVDGRTPATYDLEARREGVPPALLESAFDLVQGDSGALLEVRIEGRETFRRNRTRNVYLMFRNAGDQPMASVTLRVTIAGESDALLRQLDGDAFTEESIEWLTEDPDGTRGALLPSDSWVRVPLTFRAAQTGSVSFRALDGSVVVASRDATIVAALDPNEKEGPAGTGDGGDLMPAEADFSYAIHLENILRDGQVGISAPVQTAIVSDSLDGRLDYDSFEFRDAVVGTSAPIDLRGELMWFSLGSTRRGQISRVGSVDNSMGSFRIRVTAAVDVETAQNSETATVNWVFETLGEPADDEGFLPPTQEEDAGTPFEGQGEASVAFVVNALEPTAMETIIDNEARIFFDEEVGIDTSLVRRRIVLGNEGARFVRGDVNADGEVSLTDAVSLLGFLFLGREEPSCLDAADADDLEPEGPTLTDGVYILNWLFRGDDAPPAPGPRGASYSLDDCGTDPTPDRLECQEFAVCP